MMPELLLEIDRSCFVCGVENALGLQAVFESGEGAAHGRYTPRPEHQGYVGVSHGGILAALLDEVMVYAAATLGHWVATAEMTVRYCKPAPTGAPLAVRGRVIRRRKRLVECEAEIHSEEGVLLASATGKLIQNRPVTAPAGAEVPGSQPIPAGPDPSSPDRTR